MCKDTASDDPNCPSTVIAASFVDNKYNFKCGDGTKISADKLCNFKKDCSDGLDEKDCGDCNFESGMA